MSRSLRRLLAVALSMGTAITIGPIATAITAGAEEDEMGALGRINHFVVIYEENHSFDNLYGQFPGANGIARASSTSTTQVDLATGLPFTCLPQTDPHLVGTCLADKPFDIT